MDTPITIGKMVIDLMTERGYSLQSYADGKALLNFAKTIDDSFAIFARVDVPNKTIELSTMAGMLTISTGRFDLTHPAFERLFESSVIRAGRILQ